MYAELSFFILLLGVCVTLLSYKAASAHFPILVKPWWSYRLTAVCMGVASWMFIYQDDWRDPLGFFVLDYGIFILLRRKALPKWLAVCLTLTPLLLVKSHAMPFLSILGLSFLTFRAIDALLMNVAVDSADIGEYFLYLFFPPAILAGPMYRWREFQNDLSAAYDRLSVATMLDGWESMMLGIVQKFVVAQLIDTCLLRHLDILDYSFRGIGANAVGYSVFLYFDFAGYSNMAIGAARIFGFSLPENFKNPFATTNPQDFWKRWHVSLSEWLRDVVFTPLYKHLVTKGGMGDHKLIAQNICILATLLIMGIWNGLEPQYICSGLMFGLYSVFYNELMHASRLNLRTKAFVSHRAVRAVGRLLNLFLIVMALYVFSGRSPLE